MTTGRPFNQPLTHASRGGDEGLGGDAITAQAGVEAGGPRVREPRAVPGKPGAAQKPVNELAGFIR